MELSILENAAGDIENFNKIGLHYELVSNAIHEKRAQLGDPFLPEFIRYIIAGLISFDMERFLGKDKYSFEHGFAARLSHKLNLVKPLIKPLLDKNIVNTNLDACFDRITEAARILSMKGSDGLHSNPNKTFPVGAYKILHFINPELFIIIDSNATRVFRKYSGIPFRTYAPYGYSPERYFTCMQIVKREIQNFDADKFQSLEEKVPITRIFDKITFIKGSRLK